MTGESPMGGSRNPRRAALGEHAGCRSGTGRVKGYLEPKVEPSFHGDSYGYRPGKSAVDAVGRARERCWQYDWVVDLDIRAFFDTLDHALVMRAVRKYTDCRWVVAELVKAQ